MLPLLRESHVEPRAVVRVEPGHLAGLTVHNLLVVLPRPARRGVEHLVADGVAARERPHSPRGQLLLGRQKVDDRLGHALRAGPFRGRLGHRDLHAAATRALDARALVVRPIAALAKGTAIEGELAPTALLLGVGCLTHRHGPVRRTMVRPSTLRAAVPDMALRLTLVQSGSPRQVLGPRAIW